MHPLVEGRSVADELSWFLHGDRPGWSRFAGEPFWTPCDRTLHLYCFEVEAGEGCLLDDECPAGQACDGKGSCVPVPPPPTQLPACAPGPTTLSEWNLSLAPDWLVLADVDGDADLDVVASEPDAAQLEVAHGDGLGGFLPAATIPLGAPVESLGLAAGDVDGDGDPDLAVARAGFPGDVVVLINEGGEFMPGAPLASDSGTPTVYIVDFDSDEAPDIVINHGGFVNVHFGDGAGGFAPVHDTMNLPFFDERPFIHDITSDGLPDVVGIRGSGQLSQWQNVGGALLDNIAVYNADWTMEAVLIADLLGQQSDDYVALHAELDGSAGVALVWTAGVVPYSEYLTTSPLHGGWLGAFDGDAFPDVVAATHAPAVAVLRGDGAGGFACEQVYDVLDPTDPATLAVGDVDGDGRPDVVAGSRDGPRVAVLRLP